MARRVIPPPIPAAIRARDKSFVLSFSDSVISEVTPQSGISPTVYVIPQRI